jgi:glycine betaine/choline ABC-type transport system substrate-binding protein
VVRALGLALFLAGILTVAPAYGQASPPRLAAPSDCLTNPNCGPGFKRVYKVDVSSVFVPLTVADAGISALDDGVAEVAVAFSSDPEVSRPDIVTLRDDRAMVGPDHVVPVIRAKVLRAYGAREARLIRRRLNAASAVLNTRSLRALNQSVGDGRLPEAVGGEFIDANALGGSGGHRHGPRIKVGFMDFDENQTLAYMYAEALRSAGFRVAVKPIHGLRPDALKALRRGRISMYPGYAGSLLAFMTGKRPKATARIMSSLRRALAARGARATRAAPAQNRNLFVTKTDIARTLGIHTLSELARLWPAAR